jgi:hypothetical protein
MKHKCLFSVMVGCIFSVLFFSAHAQEEVIQISSSELGEHQRPLVTFSHQRHADMTECARCHHDFDEFGSNHGGDGQPCGECHASMPGPNPVPLMKAFHLQCKGCHKKAAATGRYNPPRTCGRCHEKPFEK